MAYKVSPRELPQASTNEYEVKYTKVIQDVDGNDVEVIDRVEYISVAQLDLQITQVEEQIASLEKQKSDLEAIKTEIEGMEE